MFQEQSNFLPFSLLESCSQTDKCPMNSLYPRISITCEYGHIAFCFPFLDVLFLQCGLQNYIFHVVSVRIERTTSPSRLTKVWKLINVHPPTKELCWCLLDSRLLAKTAQILVGWGLLIFLPNRANNLADCLLLRTLRRNSTHLVKGRA